MLPEVLAPWKEYKREAAAQGVEIVSAAVNARFKEYADAGLSGDDGETRALLKREPFFDAAIILGEPLLEREVRGAALPFLLSQGVDLIWLLDGDEIYDAEGITRTVEFIAAYPSPDFYELSFKNYLFDRHHYTLDFHPPRVFRTDRHGGIVRFEWDNELVYASGLNSNYGASKTIIPRSVGEVKHYTWQGADGEKKIAYHLKHFGYCSFRWSEKEQRAEFDPEYYRKAGLPMPTLYEE